MLAERLTSTMRGVVAAPRTRDVAMRLEGRVPSSERYGGCLQINPERSWPSRRKV
jgi:hypothetical protein